ncbi:hypothetical protein B0I29_103317 [Actinoplanes lutulentus]|uniref:Uncharacterized protein n=2 Tax=Actinoplanes lutulentus TaxID=1287878 RepID=A0A327ZG35_9ACTN|nr:hypothetical protein B0I29_103317 [Actinoplanes lutulentus]
MLALVAGCGAEEQPSPEPSIDSSFRVGDVKTFALPLDAYRLDGRQQQEFTEARLRLVKQCMEKLGYAYPLPPSIPGFLGPNEKRFGLADPKRAATVGYHDPEEDERSRRLAVEQTMTEEQEVTLNGPDGGAGCNEEVARRLGGWGLSDLVESLSHKAYAQGMADSRVSKATEGWRECLKAAGHDYPDPLEIAGDPRFTTEAATGLEIEVATIDVTCKTNVNYVNTRAAVETAYQQREVEANRAALDEVRTQNEKILAEVAKVNS